MNHLENRIIKVPLDIITQAHQENNRGREANLTINIEIMIIENLRGTDTVIEVSQVRVVVSIVESTITTEIAILIIKGEAGVVEIIEGR